MEDEAAPTVLLQGFGEAHVEEHGTVELGGADLQIKGAILGR